MICVSPHGSSLREELTSSLRGSEIPKENYNIKQPVFFGGALQDCICLLSDAVKARTRQYCKDLTMREFDADHWLQLSVPDEVNKELLEWIKGIKV